MASASKVEILRSSQKDDHYTGILVDELSEFSLGFLGPRKALQYKSHIDATAKFLYFALTTLSDFQTLGEEYCGLIQVNTTARGLPSRLQRFIMVAGFCYGPLGLRMASRRAEKYVSNHPRFTDEAKETLLSVLQMTDEIAGLVDKLNTTLFYLRGVFLHLSKRLTRVRYLSLSSRISPDDQDSTFRYLGWANLLKVALSTLVRLKKRSRTKWLEDTRVRAENKTNTKCPLCLDWMVNPSQTPCNHAFCWTCIIESTETSPECPLCREHVLPCRVQPLFDCFDEKFLSDFVFPGH